MFGFFRKKHTHSLSERIPGSVLRPYNLLREKDKTRFICFAPFNSLRINRNGGITPCCQNYNLDNIVDKSLNQVWFGKKFENLRKNIKNKRLGTFCDFCQVHLMNKNYSNVLALTYDNHPINKNGYPSYMDFTLDNTCNLSCIMCNASLSSGKEEKKMQSNIFKEIFNREFINQLKEFIPHLKSVNFSGGEPFLINTYYEIWDLISALNPSLKITCTTNGTVLNDKVIKYLNSSSFNINVSIDSLQKETYENIRINAKLQNTLNNISYFKNYCSEKSTHFSFVVCPMRLNRYEIPEFIEFGNKNNIHVNFNTLIKPYDCAIWTLPASDIAHFYEFLKSHEFPSRNELEKYNSFHFKALIELTKSWLAQAIRVEDILFKCDFEKERQVFKSNFKAIINTIDLNFNSKTFVEIDKETLLLKTENIADKIPYQLLIYDLIGKIKRVPPPFLINEIYFENEQTTIDNLCSMAYFDAMS
ncbi:MAG: radical SAM protein [Bacteroidales bacterium]|nr:radical SAM protein [Bacteroidales bacterium]